MARFARSNPRVELTVICEPTPGLVEHIKRGNLDLALVTHNDAHGQSEVVRREPLLWVTSANHATHEQETLPMAFGRPNCIWRRAACDVLDRQNRDYRILFTSFSATVITAAVLSGLAIFGAAGMRASARHAGARRSRRLRRPARRRIGIMRGQTGSRRSSRRSPAISPKASTTSRCRLPREAAHSTCRALPPRATAARRPATPCPDGRLDGPTRPSPIRQ